MSNDFRFNLSFIRHGPKTSYNVFFLLNLKTGKTCPSRSRSSAGVSLLYCSTNCRTDLSAKCQVGIIVSRRLQYLNFAYVFSLFLKCQFPFVNSSFWKSWTGLNKLAQLTSYNNNNDIIFPCLSFAYQCKTPINAATIKTFRLQCHIRFHYWRKTMSALRGPLEPTEKHYYVKTMSAKYNTNRWTMQQYRLDISRRLLRLPLIFCSSRSCLSKLSFTSRSLSTSIFSSAATKEATMSCNALFVCCLIVAAEVLHFKWE